MNADPVVCVSCGDIFDGEGYLMLYPLIGQVSRWQV